VPFTHKFAKQSRVGIFGNERTRSTPLDPKHIFRGASDRFVTAQKSMQNRPNWYEYRTSSLKNVASEFFATNAPDPLHLSQNSSFGGISDRFVTARKSMQNWPNWCHYHTSSLNKVASDFFATNAPDPLHWTQNSCFGAFQTVSLLLKVDAKLTGLLPLSHTFGKQSRVGIFRNERT
jgi:hypothetical protein